MKRPASATRGFTLLELLIGSTLAAAVLMTVLTTYVTLARGFSRSLGITSSNQPTLEGQARRTLAYFAEDVRLATDISGTPTNYSLTLVLANPGGTKQVTYYYNSTSSAATVAVSGTNVSMPANSLTRCVYDGSAVTSLTLQRNLITTNGCYLRYFDSIGYPFDNNASPYTTVATYIASAKQISLTFSSQGGSATNKTLSQVFTSASPRLVMRNKAILQ